jgi:peptidyl-prolyl cis-trans isomerase B (cyclophilin B)
VGTRTTRISLIPVVAALLLAGCGGDDEDGNNQTAKGQACSQESPPEPRDTELPAPRQTVKPGEKLTAVVKTSCGTFEIALDTARAPKTTNSFAYLARKGFYDGLAFHRIAPGFVIQGGDPLGNGSGGPGYKVDERPPPNLAYTRGVVAMAKAGVEPAGRSGSQFFVVTADAGLTPDYALVGRVDGGIEVVDRIAALGTPTEQPKRTVLIERVTIERG